MGPAFDCPALATEAGVCSTGVATASSAAGGSGLQQLRVRLEPPAARRVTELAERLRLDLANALAGDVEERAHLFERALRAVVGEPESQAYDLRFARRQRLQHLVHLVAQH